MNQSELNSSARIQATIRCINLQERTVQGYFFKKNVILYLYTIELSFGKFVWTVTRNYEEFCSLKDAIKADTKMQSEVQHLQFPSSPGHIDDAIEILQQKENLERYFCGVLSKIDLSKCVALHNFIQASVLGTIKQRISTLTSYVHRWRARKRFHNILFTFYEAELNEFVCAIEEGLVVSDGIFWIDPSDEQALFRICFAPKDVFDLPREFEDDRLANGIFLGDVAELRISRKEAVSISIVGSERTISFQWVDGDFELGQFVQMLRLLCLKGLTSNEMMLRRRVWSKSLSTRCNWTSKLCGLYPPSKSEGEALAILLSNSIPIEEEIYETEKGFHVVTKILSFSFEDYALSIMDEVNRTSVRKIYIDDISEVRPGKMCSIIDGSESVLMLTIVATDSILSLPVGNIQLRDSLIRRFQALVQLYRGLGHTSMCKAIEERRPEVVASTLFGHLPRTLFPIVDDTVSETALGQHPQKRKSLTSFNSSHHIDSEKHGHDLSGLVMAPRRSVSAIRRSSLTSRESGSSAL